jgi:hypothetical protein
MLDGAPLRNFEILKASTGGTRSFNRAAQLIWRATFPKRPDRHLPQGSPMIVS